MKLLNFTIIKLTVCLILGIATSYFLHIPFLIAICTSFLGIILLFILYQISKSKFQQNIWFGATVFLTTFFLGSFTYHLHDQKNFKKHYSHHIKNTETKSSLLTLRVRKLLKTEIYYDKYVVDLIKIDSIPVQGKALLNIEIDSLSSPFKVDDIIVTQSTLKDITPHLNPNQFNYKAYLQKQYIYHQVFSRSQEIFTLNSKPYTLLGYAASIREHILRKLRNIHLEKDDFAMLSALLLGQRQNIDPITYEQFTNAGVIHILAISGLHIGIILLILNFALKPLDYLPRGCFYKTILILIMLWGFAIITGLSASVTRAVTMFSVLAIGMNLKRPSNIYNSIAVSVFILLLFKPLFLFDVGFQLSYLAVIAIVSIQPLLSKVYKPKTKLDKLLWNIITVTIAAQFGVLPLSIYYFHQFPLLFFISNLLVIPILGLVLGLGLLIILISLLNTSYSLLTETFHYLITYMQSVITWTADKEDLIIRNIPLSAFMVLAFYLLIISTVRLCGKRSLRRLSWLMASVILLQITFIYNKHKSNKDAFIIFHKSRSSILGLHKINQLIIHHNLDPTNISQEKLLQNYAVENFVSKIEEASIKDLYMINDKPLLVVDSLGTYNVPHFRPHYILLRNSPKINLKRLIDSIHPKYIIADGSNYKSYIETWEATCQKEKLPFHHTGKKGAFIITD